MFCAGKYSMPLGRKTYIMGILNYTPDSFSDGGKYNTPEKALGHALEMRRLGADIIDIGANSTRPGADILSEKEELERILPAFEILKGKLDIPLSVDTFYPAVAEAAISCGVSIINDVSGKFNPEMAEIAKKSGAGYVVMHAPQDADNASQYENGVVSDVRNFFIECMQKAADAGLPRKQLCFDPGIGFGKTREDDIELIANAQWLKFSDAALLIGASRKRFIGMLSGEETGEKRDSGTVAAHAAAISGGADIIRAHDVYSAVQGARVADAIFRR